MSASMIVSAWLVRNKHVQSPVKRALPSTNTPAIQKVSELSARAPSRRTGIPSLKLALPFLLLPALAAALPHRLESNADLGAEVDKILDEPLFRRDLVHKLYRHEWWPSDDTVVTDDDDNENYGLGFNPKLLVPVQVPVHLELEPVNLPPAPPSTPRNKLLHLPGPALLESTNGLGLMLDDEVRLELKRLAAKQKAAAKAKAAHHHVHHHHHHHHTSNNFHIPHIDGSKPLHYTVTSATGTRTTVKCELRPAKAGEQKMSETMSSSLVNGERTTEYTEEATINGKVYHCTKKIRVPSAADRRKFMEQRKQKAEERRKKLEEKKLSEEKKEKEKERKEAEERKKKEEEEKKRENEELKKEAEKLKEAELKAIKKADEEHKKEMEKEKEERTEEEAEFKKLLDKEVQKTIDDDIINLGTNNLARRTVEDKAAKERGRVIEPTPAAQEASKEAILIQANLNESMLDTMS